MNKINETIYSFTTTIISFFCCSIPVNSLVIQTNTQEAFIFGKNNQVTQANYQIFIDFSSVEIDRQSKLNNLDTINIKNTKINISQAVTQEGWILGKNNQLYQISQQTFIDDLFLEINLGKKFDCFYQTDVKTDDLSNFESDNLVNTHKKENKLDLAQSIIQKTFISGKNNRVIQISNQVLVNSLFLEISSEIEPNQAYKNELNNSLNINKKTDGFKLTQSLTQEASIFGKNNQVNQVSYQTLINSLFLEIDLEEKLDTSLGNELNASINNLFSDELNSLMNSLLTSNQIKALSDIFYTNSQSSVNVPEPTFAFSLLFLGVLGIKSALLRKKK